MSDEFGPLPFQLQFGESMLAKATCVEWHHKPPAAWSWHKKLDGCLYMTTNRILYVEVGGAATEIPMASIRNESYDDSRWFDRMVEFEVSSAPCLSPAGQFRIVVHADALAFMIVFISRLCFLRYGIDGSALSALTPVRIEELVHVSTADVGVLAKPEPELASLAFLYGDEIYLTRRTCVKRPSISMPLRLAVVSSMKRDRDHLMSLMKKRQIEAEVRLHRSQQQSLSASLPPSTVGSHVTGR
eukprot:CAMPEP_0184655194 /NCGR_PEP_ID=MMETSP0308-20130426/12813_1 /TAXON_ID=38269 /ORGANISM="Gloeochaete witrockiana, Strain SAG 46.84" /LENGTH=242 /DNA_ID=CAMNT_0027091517 /DNA_START=75 /DNA_END=803 /DNA_ORIENTATION=+